MTRQELLYIIKGAIDRNFDGQVSFDEFVNGFASVSEWYVLYAF